MFAQYTTRGAVGWGFLGRELWEKRKDLITLRGLKSCQGHRAGLEAFGPDAVRPNDLVAIKHQVDIGYLIGSDAADAFHAGEVFCGHKDFGLAKHHLKVRRADHDAVVRAEHHIALWQIIAESTLFDADWGKEACLSQGFGADVFVADPADLLHAVIAGKDLVADVEVFDRRNPLTVAIIVPGVKQGTMCSIPLNSSVPVGLPWASRNVTTPSSVVPGL